MSQGEQAEALRLLNEVLQRVSPYAGVLNPEVRALLEEIERFTRASPYLAPEPKKVGR